MTDADIFAKLSRILETHNATDDDDDGSVVELLQRIEKDGVAEKAGQSYRAKGRTSKNLASPEPALEQRPTPYQVWEAKQEGVFSFETKETPKLSEQQWDRLVSNLHRTNKVRESATKEQNQGLAHELGGLSFRPKMNPVSEVLASTMKSLQHRLPGMINKKEEMLKKAREGKSEQEMKECTFKPHREGAKTSEKYLKKIGRQTVSPEDFIRYQEDKLRRNEQRKLIIEEIDSRELTFKPQLNAKSLKLQEKLMSDKRINIDPASRQTITLSSPIRQGTTNYDAENTWRPEISGRAKSYQSSYSGDVHNRLYTRAMEQLADHHNSQVELLQNKVSVSLKPWEVPRSKEPGAATWAQTKSTTAKAPGDELLVDPETDVDSLPVFVIECNESLAPLWKTLRTLTKMEGFFEELDASAADL